MSKARRVRSFDYVNHPYAAVRDALQEDAVGVFRAATRAAAHRARSVAAELHVNVAGLEVGKEIAISVPSIEEEPQKGTSSSVTHLQVEWEAARRPGLFPLMKAELAVYPLTSTETQLDLSGEYEPPLGALGSAVDTVVGHRIAEASVDRFVRDVAQHLRDTLG